MEDTINTPVNAGTVIITTEEYDAYKGSERSLERVKEELEALKKERLPKTVFTWCSNRSHRNELYTNTAAVKKIGEELKLLGSDLKKERDSAGSYKEKLEKAEKEVRTRDEAIGVIVGNVKRLMRRKGMGRLVYALEIEIRDAKSRSLRHDEGSRFHRLEEIYQRVVELLTDQK